MNTNPAKVTISNLRVRGGDERYEEGGDCPQVRLWNVYTQQWETRPVHMIPADVLAALPESACTRIERVRKNYLRVRSA